MWPLLCMAARPSADGLDPRLAPNRLLPFAPEIVLEQLRELEAPTRPTTSSPSPSSPHTRLTIRSLKRQANSLEEITADLSPNYYSAEAWKICSWQSCASIAWCTGSRRSSTHKQLGPLQAGGSSASSSGGRPSTSPADTTSFCQATRRLGPTSKTRSTRWTMTGAGGAGEERDRLVTTCLRNSGHAHPKSGSCGGT